MADTELLRQRVQGLRVTSKLSWEERLLKQFTGTWWGHGDPPDDVLNLGPNMIPGAGWRVITRTEAAAALRRLGLLAGQRRELGPGPGAPFAVPAPSAARAAASAVARERRPSRVERAVARAQRARQPRPARAARRPRAPRRPRRPRAARPPRPPRAPRPPRIKGTKNGGQLWCYGLRFGFTLYPPPSARSFPEGYDPNVELSQPGLWTKANSLADCAGALCTGPLGQAFADLVRRLFGPRPTEPPPPPRRALRRDQARRRATLPNPVPVAGNPLPPPATPTHPIGECCPVWEYKYGLYPPPNRRPYPCGYDPNTLQPGLWRCLTAAEAAAPPS